MTVNVLIAGVQVPYTRGGAELLVDMLKAELVKRGYCVDVVQLPFSSNSREEIVRAMYQWRSLDLTSFSGRKVDVLITTKFPSYLAKHPNKSVWLVHQHRQVYDLFGSRFGESGGVAEDEAFRQMIYDADAKAFSEARTIQTISPNVAGRLERFLGIALTSIPNTDSAATADISLNSGSACSFGDVNRSHSSSIIKGGVLLPPLPMEGSYYSEPYVEPPYILSVGRICTIKRVDMILKSLPKIDSRLSLKIVGVADEDGVESYLKNEIDKHHLWHRVQFLGKVGKDELLRLFAQSFAVYYAPYDEDYGFVTLEALASGKPVITASDSGGVLEFIRDGFNGVVSEPKEENIAHAVNKLFREGEYYRAILDNTKASAITNTWDEVINGLIDIA